MASELRVDSKTDRREDHSEDRTEGPRIDPVKFGKPEVEEVTVPACLFCKETRKTLHLKQKRRIYCMRLAIFNN